MLYSAKFWTGLLYCTFPLNLLVYGMNDLMDEDADYDNPRKGNFVYGAKTTRSQRQGLPMWIGLVNIVYLVALGLLTGDLLYVMAWFVCALCVNYLYNYPPFQLSRKCPWEIPCMIAGHFLIPLLACRINRIPFPSLPSWIFNALLLARSHIWLEYADIEGDEKCNKRTLAVVMGKAATLRIVMALTLIEAFVGFFLLKSHLIGIFSVLGMIVFYIASSRRGEFEMVVSTSQSVVGLYIMVYTWINKILV